MARGTTGRQSIAKRAGKSTAHVLKEQPNLIQTELEQLNLQRELLDRRRKGLDEQSTARPPKRKGSATEQLHSVLKALPTYAAHFNKDQRLLFCNRASAGLSKTQTSISGTRLWELMGPSLYDAARPSVLQALTGTAASCEATVNEPEARHLLCQFIPDALFACRGGGFVCLVADRTDQSVLERKPEDTRQKAKQTDHVLAAISHELRNPLNAILGWVVLIKENRVDGEHLPAAMEAIEKNARLQARLIEQLMDVSQLTLGKMALRLGPVDLKAILFDAVDAIRPAAMAKAVALSVHMADGDCTLQADAMRLVQVFNNLLANALKFTPTGGEITVRLAGDDPEFFVVEVRDTGSGIPPENLTHVFDEYWQSPAHRRQGEGLGVGLSIAQSLVELHGGSIDVASEGSQAGSVFMVKLPRRRAGL